MQIDLSSLILLVAPSPPPYGGMALQARQLEKLLKRDGVPVTFFASNAALPGSLRFFERYRGLRTLLHACAIWFQLVPRIRECKIVHVLAASWLYFFLVVYPAVLLGRIFGRRVVVNYRGGEAREFFQQYGWLAPPVFRLADSVTAPSEFLAEEIRNRFQVDVAIVPNILDTSIFQYRQRTVIEPRVLVTRHLEPLYDIESVLKAFRAIQDIYPQSSLWIAGTGSQEGCLRQLASAWNLKNIRFLGHIAHQDLPRIYGQCDIYLNASLADNFPGSLVEASAAGLVVVSTKVGGIPFIYQNGETAFLVEPGDWQGLSKAVQNVLDHPSQALKMTEAAISLVRACDWLEVRKALYSAYGFTGWSSVGVGANTKGAKCAAG